MTAQALLVLALMANAAPAFPTCAVDQSWCVAFSPFDDVTSALTETIRGARKSVRVAVFNISSASVAAALVERARAGVDVEVMIDFSRPENAAIASLLSEPTLRFVRVPSLRGGGPQMHEKVFVIDDAWVVAGTGNLTDAAMSSSAETWIATRDSAVVHDVRADLDFLLHRVTEACHVFGLRSSGCPFGRVVWDAPFEAYARTGKFAPTDVVRGPRCASFMLGRERLESWPADRSRADVAGCLRDPRFRQLASKLGAPEPRSALTVAVDEVLSFVRASPPPPRQGIQLVSSHATDIEEMFLQAISAPRPDPFALVAMSRLHEKNVVEALADASARGVRTRITVGSFLHGDAGGTAAGELLLSRFAASELAIGHDGFVTRGSLFHDKSAVIGGAHSARLFFSSANWSAQALTRSDESFFVIDDPALIAQFTRNILRERSLIGADVADDARFLQSRVDGLAALLATSVLVVRAPVPSGVDPRAEAHMEMSQRTVPLRWDGSQPAAWVGAVTGPPGANIDVTVVYAGGRVPLTLRIPEGLAAVGAVSLPPAQPAP